MKRYLLFSFIAAGVLIGVGLFVFAAKQQKSQEQISESAPTNRKIVDSTNKAPLSKNQHALKDQQPLADRSKAPFSTANLRGAHRSPQVILPDQPVSTYLEILTQAAKKGDAEAAYRISVALDKCAMYRPMRQYESLAHEYAKCQDLTDEQISQGLYWLIFAAENGNEAAQIRYSLSFGRMFPSEVEMVRDAEGLIQFKINALRYLQNASLTGNVNAMIALAQHYKDGFIVPNDGESAYAYMYAADRTNLFGPIPVLQVWQKGFTAEQIARATQLGNQIYQQCCSR